MTRPRKRDVERVFRIPKRGLLYWTRQYAKVGNRIKVYPILGGTPVEKSVLRVGKNRMGRISYFTNDGTVLTEELVPQHHARVQRDACARAERGRK